MNISSLQTVTKFAAYKPRWLNRLLSHQAADEIKKLYQRKPSASPKYQNYERLKKPFYLVNHGLPPKPLSIWVIESTHHCPPARIPSEAPSRNRITWKAIQKWNRLP
jgi:hypothetical protein